jgi:Icc-related predicted phosphoesterase
VAVKLIADVHSSIRGIEGSVGPGDTLLVLGDVLGLIDWADFSGILPEVLGKDNLRRMLFGAFAAGAEAARRMKEELLSPKGEYYELLQKRVLEDYREFRRVVEGCGCSALVIYGNSDLPEAMQEVFQGSPSVRLVEGRMELEGQTFGFLPGSLKSPFEMPAEEDDDYFEERLENMGEVDVVCAHVPPEVHAAVFDVVAGRPQRGSAALLRYIEKCRPLYVYHGHVHQPAQRSIELGSTRVVNVAYFKRERYVHPHGGETGEERERSGTCGKQGASER